MIDPKKKFQEQLFTKGWTDVADSGLFHAAAEAALAQMALNQSFAGDMASAAAAHYKIQGAKDFLGILMSLGLKPEPRKTVSVGNLKHPNI